MAKKRASKERRLLLTDRALRDIADVRDYSIEHFGRRVANQHIRGMENALTRLRKNAELLRAEPELHSWLKFYRCQEHLFVCDLQFDAIFVLTVIHASMDIPSRLVELEPTLKTEVNLLHEKLRQSRK